MGDTTKIRQGVKVMILKDKVDMRKEWLLYAGNSVYNNQDYAQMDVTRQCILLDTDVILVDETPTQQVFEARYCPPVNHYGESVSMVVPDEHHSTKTTKKLPLLFRLFINIFILVIRIVIFLVGVLIAAFTGVSSLIGHALTYIFNLFYLGGFILIGIVILGWQHFDKGMIIAISSMFVAGMVGTLFATSLSSVVSSISSAVIGLALKIKFL